MFDGPSDTSDIETGKLTDDSDGGWASSDEDILHRRADSEVDEEDEEVDDNEEEEEPQVPIQEGSIFSPSWSEGSDFTPDIHEFQSTGSGATRKWPCNEEARESDFFCAFFDQQVMSHIAEKTNNYFKWVYGKTVFISPFSRLRKWVDTTPKELFVFFALLILMPLSKKHYVKDYWRNEPLLTTPVFNKYMTRDRFFGLFSFLQFTDRENPDCNDRLWKVRTIFTMIVSRFQTFFYPFRKLVIDESLVLYKGRLAFKQYIPSKRHRFGIKIFVLCDCETGMILDMIVYTGTDIDIPKVKKSDPLGMSGAIVKKMISRYLGKGHILYTDNWYTSPALCHFLHENKTGSCGTVRNNRKFMPKFTVNMTRLENPSSSDEGDEVPAQNERRKRRKGKKKDRYTQREKSGEILAVKWNDKRAVHLLTTIHKGEVVETGKVHHRTQKPIMKPDLVTDYTQNMRLVDKSDSQLSNTECLRKSSKWYIKFFFHLLDTAMLNAYNMWLVTREMDPSKKLKLREFVYNVAYQLLEKYGEPTNVSRGRPVMLMPDRIVEGISRHYPVHTEKQHTQAEMENENGQKGRRSRLNCYVCSHTSRKPQKRTRVNTMCAECNVGLCLGECFRDYHTLKCF